MKTLALFSVLILASFHASGAERTPYLFINFDDASVFPPGEIAGATQGIQVITPVANVVKDEAGPKSHLQVSGSVVLLANRFTGDGQTHFEAWVRPQAVTADDGMEFLDYDGAVLAMFRTDEDHAEIHALHMVSADVAFWVSTGVQIPIKNGIAVDWHVIHIQQHWEQSTWDLTLDGVMVLQGLGRGQYADGKLTEVWLYGHGDQSLNAFDDLLLSADAPDVLERELAAHYQRRTSVAAQAQQKKKLVGRSTTDSHRRQKTQAQPDPKKIETAKILDVSLQVVGGGRHIGEFESTEKDGKKKKFALYTPGYDENGKPKPLEVQIRCDAELKEGASLDDIEWAITEHPKDGEEQVRVILSGTFQSGPSLIAKVPSEWSNKPLSIRCGTLGLRR